MKQPLTGTGLPALFSLTLFLSAGLVFLVQPMFGKMVLPLFGGAPSVWNTCQVFFQAALLAGYVYAHLLSTRLAVRWQVALHGLVLLVPLVSLPIAVAAGWEPPGDASPVPSLWGLLTISVGLPFVVVSTTAPLLQGWFARSGHAAAGDPYFLYAASNAGSLLALLAYPLVLEPALPLSMHSWIWAAGYLLLIGLVIACGIRVWQATSANPSPTLAPSNPHTPAPVAAPDVTPKGRLHWLALAFVPSSLLLSVTLHITTDIAAVPLLWVVPLAIYLATFILAFARRQLIPVWVAARMMPLVVIALVIVFVSEATEPVWILMLVHLAAFFMVSLVCHGELARKRPPAEHLTEFYLWMSLGGILGGLFSALVAPLLFRTIVEYPLVLVLACLLRPPPPAASPAIAQDRQARRKKKEKAAIADAVKAESGAAASGRRISPWLLDLLLPVALGLAIAALIWACELYSKFYELLNFESLAIAFALPGVVCYLFLHRPARFALGIAAMLLASQLRPSIQGQILHVERSFFGVHRVAVDPSGQFMQLVHGSTVHGKQRLAESPAGGDRKQTPTPGPAEPLNYYHRRGPAGDLFALPQVKQERLPVAVVGLGTGSLAAYIEPGQGLDYYEIDPVVKRIAEDGRYFTFLRECRGRYRILLGDARLKIRTAEDGQYGLIVVDAFSSDAVPLHLITREAIAVYERKLADRGCLAFHISNRYLDLSPVLANLARDRKLACLVRADIFGDHVPGQDPSIWVVLARRETDLAGLPRPREGVSPGLTWTAATPAKGPVWTDQRANLFSAWNWRSLSQ